MNQLAKKLRSVRSEQSPTGRTICVVEYVSDGLSSDAASVFHAQISMGQEHAIFATAPSHNQALFAAVAFEAVFDAERKLQA